MKLQAIHIILIGVLISFSPAKCFGGDSVEDSLNNVLKESSDVVKTDTYSKFAALNYSQNNFSNAIKYYKKAAQYQLRNNNLKEAIFSINLIGHSYIKQEKYNNALKNYLIALKLSEDINDSENIAKTLNNIGRYYGYLNDYEKALSYYLQSFKIIETLDSNTVEKSKLLNNIGMCYGYLDNVDKSLAYFNQSLPLRYELGNQEDISILLNNIGYAYSLKGDYDKAFEQLYTSLKICEEIADKKGCAFALLNIAELHNSLKQYKQAIPILLRSLKLAQEIKSDILIQDSYKFLSEAYAGIGDSKNGLLYYQKFNAIQQKLFQEKLNNKLGNLHLLNDLKVKEKELIQLNEEKKIAKLKLEATWNYIYSLMVFLLIIIICFSVFYILKQRLNNANLNLVLKNLEIVKNENKLKKSAEEIVATEINSFETSNTSKYEKSPLTQQQKDDLLNTIIDKIENEKLFLREDLTLLILSEIMNTNKSYISQIINETFEKNFNSFINEYRIKEARYLLSQEENLILTIEAIANSVGFKSMSPFNSAFKKFTGITPSYFIEKVKSNALNE